MEILLACCVLGVIFTAWLGCVAWMWHKQQDLLYPNPGITEGNGDHHPVENGPEGLRAWIDNPGCDRAVLYFGGSGEAVEKRRQTMADRFPGYTRYFLPHRGAGPNRAIRGGEWNIKKDAEALLNMARERHARVHVIGRSLGTSLALHLAAGQRLDGLALITPFSSIAEVAARRYRWLPVRTMLRDKHEAWRDAQRLACPVLACLARHDKVTIRAHWERLARQLTGQANVHLAECDHESILDDPGTWEAIQAWFMQSGRMNDSR